MSLSDSTKSGIHGRCICNDSADFEHYHFRGTKINRHNKTFEQVFRSILMLTVALQL